MSKQGRAPIIGVTACKRDSTFGPWNIEAVILPSTYTDIIEEAGGQPILLPPGCCSSNLDFLDGLVVAGGPDIHPSLYGQEPSEHVYSVSYTHLRAHETEADLVCRLLLEKKK